MEGSSKERMEDVEDSVKNRVEDVEDSVEDKVKKSAEEQQNQRAEKQGKERNLPEKNPLQGFAVAVLRKKRERSGLFRSLAGKGLSKEVIFRIFRRGIRTVIPEKSICSVWMKKWRVFTVCRERRSMEESETVTR